MYTLQNKKKIVQGLHSNLELFLAGEIILGKESTASFDGLWVFRVGEKNGNDIVYSADMSGTPAAKAVLELATRPT